MEIVYIKDITEYILKNLHRRNDGESVIEGMMENLEGMMENPIYTGYTSIQGDKLELFWFYQCEAGKKLLWTAILEQFSVGRNIPTY